MGENAISQTVPGESEREMERKSERETEKQTSSQKLPFCKSRRTITKAYFLVSQTKKEV